MITSFLAAFAAPPSVSVLPYAEVGPSLELRASGFGPESFVGGELQPRMSTALGAVWRPGRFRIESTVWRPFAPYARTTGVATAQLKLIHNETITIAPWVSGTLRVSDPACEVGCSTWDQMDRRPTEYWGGFGATLTLSSKQFTWTLVAPALIDMDYVDPFRMVYGSILTQQVAMDWRLHDSFPHPEGLANTVRLSVRNLGPLDWVEDSYSDLVPRYDTHEGGVDLAWRHERGDVFLEGRGSYVWSGPSIGVTVGWTPKVPNVHVPKRR